MAVSAWAADLRLLCLKRDKWRRCAGIKGWLILPHLSLLWTLLAKAWRLKTWLVLQTNSNTLMWVPMKPSLAWNLKKPSLFKLTVCCPAVPSSHIEIISKVYLIVNVQHGSEYAFLWHSSQIDSTSYVSLSESPTGSVIMWGWPAYSSLRWL